MALFPRYSNAFGADFAPLLRLLDEGLGDVSRQVGRHASVRAFSPRFDVNENKDTYQLYGELPGIEQKNVEIEFTDPHTLVIKGRSEHSYTSGTPALEGAPVQGRIEDTVDDSSSTQSHKATVEDETPEAGTSEPSPSEATPSSEEQPKHKAWISERSVGEFHRSFSFPQRVDQDLVKASLKNGILSIVVPKAKAPESRRINIE